MSERQYQDFEISQEAKKAQGTRIVDRRGNDTNSAITTIAGGTAVARDPDSSAGCPLCNSSEAEAE